MDTPTIAAYYKESDPLKRRNLLKQSTEAGEEPEANEIRREIWETRYQRTRESRPDEYADRYLGLWMNLEFNRGAEKRWFGLKKARKDIGEQLTELKFGEFQEKSELHRELLYRECCHLVALYIEISRKDKNYNSFLFGIMNMNSQSSENKLRRDIQETAVLLPKGLGMEKELGVLIKAAREVYGLYFPGE